MAACARGDDDDLVPTHSKLVAWPASSTAFAAISATAVGFAGVADGVVVSGMIDLTAAPDELDSDAAALVARDWRAALGLRLNDNGEPVPFDPIAAPRREQFFIEFVN